MIVSVVLRTNEDSSDLQDNYINNSVGGSTGGGIKGTLA